jgi:hypothetical protein
MHLLVCISPHGYGHTAQIAPVVNALHRRLPALAVTLRTTVPDALLKARFDMPFTHINEACDFGMVMASSVDVLAADSAAVYADLHRDWPRQVDREAARLKSLKPDLVLANVPYLPLAGAARAGLASAALCSLNWADIFAHYCADSPRADAILADMLDAYRSARVFLRPQPCMPMDSLANTRAIGPVTRLGIPRRDGINNKLGLAPRDRLVLVAPGGIPTRWPIEDWPRRPGLRYIVQDDWRARHPDAVSLEALGMPFVDVLASCDALLGKPGYGSVVECVCNGTPFLYVKRGDWPEEPYLLDWLHTHGRGAAIDREAVQSGAFGAALETLLAQPVPDPVPATGIEQAATVLSELLIRIS